MDEEPEAAPDAEEWLATFRGAEALPLDVSLAMTRSQRLAWLEQALAFAAKTGALPKR
jgi:hypothetical protein